MASIGATRGPLRRSGRQAPATGTSGELSRGEVAAQIAALRRYRDDLPPHSEAGTRGVLDERLAALEGQLRALSASAETRAESRIEPPDDPPADPRAAPGRNDQSDARAGTSNQAGTDPPAEAARRSGRR